MALTSHLPPSDVLWEPLLNGEHFPAEDQTPHIALRRALFLCGMGIFEYRPSHPGSGFVLAEHMSFESAV